MSILDSGDYKLYVMGYRAGLSDAWEQAQHFPEDLKGTYAESVSEHTIIANMQRHILKGVNDERDNTDRD